MTTKEVSMEEIMNMKSTWNFSSNGEKLDYFNYVLAQNYCSLTLFLENYGTRNNAETVEKLRNAIEKCFSQKEIDNIIYSYI